MVTLDKKAPNAGKPDPRTYIRPVPVPLTSHRGVRIQARNDQVYCASVPTRDDVRRDNYVRRKEQLTQRGFSAYNYRPYKGIGDPFYLDEKALILHSLGQWNETDNDDSCSSSDDEPIYLESRPQKVHIPRRYVYKVRRQKTKLNKEIKTGRDTVRDVRLGRGFFHVIEEQRQKKQEEQLAQERAEREGMVKDWTSGESSSDDEDLHDYMADAVEIKSVRTSAPSSAVSRPTPRSGGRSPRPLTAKRRSPSRPYTPIHSSLLNEEADDYIRDSLFRQLCALHWLLEAMNNDGSAPMAPIMTSWNVREIGGQKVSQKKLIHDKTTETAWTTFQTTPVSIYPPAPATKIFAFSSALLQATKKWGGLKKTQRKITQHRGSVDSTSTGRSAKSGSENSDKDEDEDEANKNLFRFLDDYYESLKKDELLLAAQREGAQSSQDGGQNKDGAESRTHSRRHRTEEEKAARRARKMDSARDSVSGEHPAMSLRAQTMNSIRPRSSPALVEFQQNAMSNRYSSLSRDMNRDFSLVDQEKSTDLKESLSHLERSRYKNCRNKFVSLRTNHSTVDKALRHMRHAMLHQRRLEQNRLMSDISPWFSELLNRVPPQMKDLWYFNLIIDKLSEYVENGKVTSIKFQKVLSTLRDWEICSPDVAAAVEFCREKIVEMPVEDFEKWFTEHFPSVERPSLTPILTQVDEAARSSTRCTSARPRTAGSIRSRYT